MRVNGRKVGDHVLDPAWTTYDKRVLYATYDVTMALRDGANAVAVMLGEGWYKSRVLLFQLNVEMEDGSTATVASDASWKAAEGPIFADSVYNGESYDARRETPGWDRPGFDDKAWPAAETVMGPAGVLSAQLMPAIRVVDTIVPFRMTSPLPGVYVFDMGQNFSGWARLRVEGPRGTDVRLRFAELLYENGTLNQETLRSAQAEDHYILKGEGEETWEPRFTYHGFRYVEVTRIPRDAHGSTASAAASSTRPSTPIGSFAASKDVLNGLQRIITWGQKTNLHSIPTDCSQRDERMGWMGDAQGTAEEAIMNFDMAAFYTNFVRDIRDVQDEKGRITDTVPHIWGSRPADPAWGTAYPLICWYMYQYYGDTRVLEEHYDGLKKYVEFLRSDGRERRPQVEPLRRLGGHREDVPARSSRRSTTITTSRSWPTRRESSARPRTRPSTTSWRPRSASPSTGSSTIRRPANYADGTQTANTLALFLDLPTEKQSGCLGPALRRHRLRAQLASDDGHHRHQIHHGAPDPERERRPGLRHRLQDRLPELGLHDRERGDDALGARGNRREGPSMNSHNHPMFGSVGSWLYKALAGINLAPGTSGFEKVLIAPQMVWDLTHASGSTVTVRGEVACSWSRTERSVRVEVTDPGRARSAEIVIPRLGIRNITVTEGGRTVWAGDNPTAASPGSPKPRTRTAPSASRPAAAAMSFARKVIKWGHDTHFPYLYSSWLHEAAGG
ncbi:MAG: glycoside hydrolase family 78 protein [Marinilabiliales bacterium]|nr:glycoside hydrolase family 78 protein [Marinilabiliales bacterium]